MNRGPDEASKARMGVEALCRELYYVLLSTGHAPYCRAALSVGYDEARGVWHPPDCDCGREAALERYEDWWAKASTTEVG